MDYLLALDAGTTSNRAIVFSADGQAVGQHQILLPQHYPADGWVEHDAADILSGLIESGRMAIQAAGLRADQIAGVGLTNQRETTLVWDKATGQTIYPAIVWQDRRTANWCAQAKDQGHEAMVQSKTGLLLDPYFSATKAAWILDNVEGARARAEVGELAFGTVDSFVAWHLSGGRSHIIEATNAARTLLFNIDTQAWDTELLALFNVPANLLPQVVDSAGDLADIDASIWGAPMVLSGIAGDQHAALIGQAGIQPGMLKSTYGTGCFMIANTGVERRVSNQRLLSTLAYRLNGQPTYALEGAIFNVGTAIQWLRDNLKLFNDAAQTQAMAQEAKSDDGVYLVPAFTGLGAPWWDPHARGLLCGLTRDTGPNEMVRAALEAAAYQTADLTQAMEADGQRVSRIRVDGGMVVNDWFCQALADITGACIDRPQVTETTALGAALLAGLGVGVFDSLEQACQSWQLDQSFERVMPAQQAADKQAGWLRAIARATTH